VGCQFKDGRAAQIWIESVAVNGAYAIRSHPLQTLCYMGLTRDRDYVFNAERLKAKSDDVTRSLSVHSDDESVPKTYHHKVEKNEIR
jgi:hypothetical protein